MPPTHLQEAPPPSDTDRLPLKSKLAYGVGQLSGTLQSGTDDRLLLPIFVNTLHVSPALISTLMVVYRVWDALTDMLVGWMSDNTRTRWGRRRPYLLVGTVLSSVLLPAFWHLDAAWSPAAILTWMIAGQLLLIMANTLWNIPYQSLLFELTPSSVERTNIVAVRSYFAKAAQLALAWVWWLAERPVFGGADGKIDILRGAFWVSALIALLVLTGGVITTCFTRERSYAAAIKAPKIPLWPNLKMTLSNRSFQLLALAALLFVLSTKTIDTLLFYIRLYHVSKGDTDLASRLAGLSSTLEICVSLASVPLVQWCCRRFGKRATFTATMSLFGAGGVSTWFFFTPAHPYLSIVSSLLLYPAAAAIYIVIPSLLGDVVDDEELKSGSRREGSFAAAFSWLFKLSFSIGLAFSGLIILWTGFDVKLGAAQTEGVMSAIRLSIVAASLVLMTIAILVCAKIPLTTRRIEEIRAALEARRGRL